MNRQQLLDLTDRVRRDLEEVYSASAGCRLPYLTNYMPALIKAARTLVKSVYKPVFAYHKAGALLADIVPETERQQSVFAGVDDERRLCVMRAVDEINRRHGWKAVRPLAVSTEPGWEMRRARLSPRYTTRLDEVLRVKAC